MGRTTISWGDGSGDNIYLDYNALEGTQTVTVSSDANSGSSSRTKTITFSTTGATPVTQTLTVIQEAGSTGDLIIITRNDVAISHNETALGYKGPVLPYTPLEYIETDGVAYISTGIIGTPPRSCEIKAYLPSTTPLTNTKFGVLCAYTVASSYNTRNFALFNYYGGTASFSFYYNYGPADGTPSLAWSIENASPFVVKTTLKRGAQTISIKQDNSESWVSLSKAQTGNVSSTYLLVLFNGYQNSSYSIPAPSGTRIYYCKIYSDDTYTTLVRDYVPCIYNGEYGLWDKVSDSFFGNSAGSGAFTGA